MKIPEPAIYELLKLFAAGNVFPERAPDNAPGPFVVFQRAGGDRVRSLQGPSGLAKVSIQIDAYDARYYASKALAAAIEETLDGYRGTVTVPPTLDYPAGFDLEITGISLQSEIDLIDKTDTPLLFRDSKTYLVSYRP